MKKNNLLRLDIQFFAADPGAAAATAAAPDPSLAGAGGTSAATGADSTQGATGDTTTGGGDTVTGSGSTLSAEDLKRYEESDFLKALGYDSIDAAKTALEAAKALQGTKPAGDEKASAGDQPGDKKADDPDNVKADDKTKAKADGKADDLPPGDEPEKKPEPTVAEKEVEISDLKAELAAAKNGVPEESLEDVLVLAKALAQKGEGMEIDAAIKSIIEKYPSFRGAAAPTSDRPRFGDSGSQRQADETDPFVRTLFGK